MQIGRPRGAWISGYIGDCVTPRDRGTVRPVGEQAGQHRLSKEKQARQQARGGGLRHCTGMR